MTDPIIEHLRAAGVPASKNGVTPKLKKEKDQAVLPDRANSELKPIADIDELLKPISFSSGAGNELDKALAEERKEKIEIAKNFMSSPLQKTEISATERKLLPLLRIMARAPFGTTKAKYQHKELTEWTKEYITFGIAVNRKGRGEEVEILKGLFSESLEVDKRSDGIAGKLRSLGR